METETIDDVMVAEFMDFRHDYHLSHVHGDDVYSHPIKGWWPVNEPFIKDWNTLMPVLEKIGNMMHDPNGPVPYTLGFKLEIEKVLLLPVCSHIQQVYKSVLAFIKWYNNQKENGNRNS